MILVDTSVWIEVLRDKRGDRVNRFRERLGDEEYALCRFTQLELLQGAKDEREWNQLNDYLAHQYYLETSENTWRDAARIFFELRRGGITVRSPIDCCIAQIAIEHGALLLHRDADFERIAGVCALEQTRL